MMRHEKPFVIDGDLIILEALVTGPRAATKGRFVLDTGAVMTTLTPDFVESLGYSARDGYRRARVRTAVGSEDGYLLRVAEFAVLGVAAPRFPIHVFDLGHDDIDGLVGQNFLSEFNYEVRSAEQRILIEKIESGPRP